MAKINDNEQVKEIRQNAYEANFNTMLRRLKYQKKHLETLLQQINDEIAIVTSMNLIYEGDKNETIS